jgi:hypothetical protein
VANRAEDERGGNRLGLCAGCVHAQQVRSSKGSTFLLCGRSKSDPSFPKYPRLPVLACRGYQKADRAATPEELA